MPTKTLKQIPDHPIAGIFPMMEPDDFNALVEHIKKNGLQEPIVLYEDKILDGRNRYEACDVAGVEPMLMEFESMSDEIRAAGPVEFVWGRNNARRHLTASVRATCAAAAVPFFEADAAARKKAGLKQNQPSAQTGANGDELSQETGHDAADESQVPTKKKRPGEGKATAQAAKKFKVGTRSVEKARKLLKTDPKKFEAVKAGKLSLNKATKDVSAAERKARELTDALKRIGEVCGKASMEKAQSRKRAEIIGWAAMKDPDMQKIAGLMDSGWKLETAKKFRVTSLTWKSTLRDLRNRCDASGGKFTEDLGDGYTVEIKRVKTEPKA